MKIYISADIEGVNGILNWEETEHNGYNYNYYQQIMTNEVKAACISAKACGAKEIFVKDAHSTARNLIINDLPTYVTVHQGWEGVPCSMMAGLDSSFDYVMYIGYHSPSRSDGNPLSHTMNTHIHHVKINGQIASEFLINSLYASYLNVPILFLSGDEALTKSVQEYCDKIEVVATKKGVHGAVVSPHPSIIDQEISDKVKLALTKEDKPKVVPLPKMFDVEIQYKNHAQAYSASFYPGCKLVGSDKVIYHSTNYYDVLVMFKFIL